MDGLKSNLLKKYYGFRIKNIQREYNRLINTSNKYAEIVQFCAREGTRHGLTSSINSNINRRIFLRRKKEFLEEKLEHLENKSGVAE